jgi:hypothetical protein
VWWHPLLLPKNSCAAAASCCCRCCCCPAPPRRLPGAALSADTATPEPETPPRRRQPSTLAANVVGVCLPAASSAGCARSRYIPPRARQCRATPVGEPAGPLRVLECAFCDFMCEWKQGAASRQKRSRSSSALHWRCRFRWCSFAADLSPSGRHRSLSSFCPVLPPPVDFCSLHVALTSISADGALAASRSRWRIDGGCS